VVPGVPLILDLFVKQRDWTVIERPFLMALWKARSVPRGWVDPFAPFAISTQTTGPAGSAQAISSRVWFGCSNMTQVSIAGWFENRPLGMLKGVPMGRLM